MKKRMYWSLAIGCAMMAMFGCSNQQSSQTAPQSSAQESAQESGQESAETQDPAEGGYHQSRRFVVCYRRYWRKRRFPKGSYGDGCAGDQ